MTVPRIISSAGSRLSAPAPENEITRAYMGCSFRSGATILRLSRESPSTQSGYDASECGAPATDESLASACNRSPRNAILESVMSDSSSLTLAQQGFDAWRRGDFDALEDIFAPDVEWRWFKPGEWDCHTRDDVMRRLRQRHAAGFADGRLNFHDAAPDVVVVTAHPSEIGGPGWAGGTSTGGCLP